MEIDTPSAAPSTPSIPSSDDSIESESEPNPFPHKVIELIESLVEHIIQELLQIHYERERHREEEEEHMAKQKSIRRAAILAGRDPPPFKKRRTRRRKKQVVIQYQPAATNALFNNQGQRIFNPDARHTTTVKNDSVELEGSNVKNESPYVKGEGNTSGSHGSSLLGCKRESAPAPAPLLSITSRWMETPSSSKSRTSRKRKNNQIDEDTSGSSGSQNASQTYGSQSLEEEMNELSESQDDGIKGESGDSAAAIGSSTTERRVLNRKLIYPRHEKRFAGLVTSLADCYVALQDSISLTKRDIHYKDKDLFPKQSNSDAAIDLLCDILQIRTEDLRVIASSNAQVEGALWYEVAASDEPNMAQSPATQRMQVEKVDCNRGALITPYARLITGMSCDVDWVLLIEKNTVYSKVVQSGFPHLNRCLVVADRGMPSKLCRRFLKKFHRFFPNIPMYGLFDPDPAGLDIFRVCKYGAARSVHEDLALSTLQLLGVSITDLEHLGILHQPNVGLPLTAKDRRKLEKMMQSEEGSNDAVIQRECQEIIRCQRKSEIEALSKVDEYYLTDTYLAAKLDSLRDGKELQPLATPIAESMQAEVAISISNPASKPTSVKVEGTIPAAPIQPSASNHLGTSSVTTSTSSVSSPSDPFVGSAPYGFVSPSATAASHDGLAPMELDGEDELDAIF